MDQGRAETVTYEHVTGIDLRADIYLPPEGTRPTGAVLWLHEGALVFGSRRFVPDRILDLGRRERIAVISVDYRLAPQVGVAEIASDVAAALAWVTEGGDGRFKVDSKRIMVAGASAGGYLALLLGASSTPPAAILSYYGYGTLDSPWYTHPSPHYLNTMPLIGETEALAAVSGSTMGDDAERPDAWKFYVHCRQAGIWPRAVAGFDPILDRNAARLHAPTYLVTDRFPATMLVHGTADSDVPHAESAALAALFELHGVAHEFVSLTGLDHGLVPSDRPGEADAVQAAHAQAAAFVSRHVGLGAATD